MYEKTCSAENLPYLMLHYVDSEVIPVWCTDGRLELLHPASEAMCTMNRQGV